MRSLSALLYLFFVFALAAQSSDVSAQDKVDDFYSSAALLKAAADCGLPKEAVASEYVDDLQSDVYRVTVGPDGKYRGAAICLAYWNNGVGHFIEFDDAIVRDREDAATKFHSKRSAKSSGDWWLSGARLSDAKRPFDPVKETIEEYLHYIEVTCKSQPGSLLTSLALSGTVTFVPARLGQVHDEDFLWSFGCAMSMMAFADLEKHGLSFGFIGNEAFSDK